MNYTLVDIKKLREETGASLLDCKQALVQAKTWDEALKLLAARSEGKAQHVKSSGRETGEGGIFSYIHHNNRVGVLLELNCSSDFVARTESFRQLARELALHIAAAAPAYVSYEDVPARVLRAVRKRIVEEDPAIGQFPVKKRREVVAGKLKAELRGQVLLMQPWVRDGAMTVNDLVSKVIADTGENIVVHRFCRYELGEAGTGSGRK